MEHGGQAARAGSNPKSWLSARAIGLVGCFAFLLIVLATAIAPLWEFPTTTASGEEVLDYVSERRDAVMASVVAYAFGMSGFFLFAVLLADRFRPRPGREVLRTVFTGAFAALLAVVLAGFAFMLAMAHGAEEMEPGTAALLYDLCFGTLALSGVPTAIAFGAIAFGGVSGGALDATSRALAAVAAAAHLIVAFSFFPDSGFFSLEGGVIVAIPATMFVWLAYTSVRLVWAVREDGER